MMREPKKKEAQALKKAGRGYDEEESYSWPTTRPGRYSRAMEEVTGLAAGAAGKELIVHLIGVGEGGGPQLREAISALRGKFGGNIEVHVTDRDKDFLQKAVGEAKAAFPTMAIVPHHTDIISPSHTPVKQADITICTNVLSYADGRFRDVGFYNVASLMKKGGYLLVSSTDAETSLPAAEFGLKELRRVDEPEQYRFDLGKKYTERGVILQKVAHNANFDKIWKKLQVKE